jgi:outer membrane protein
MLKLSKPTILLAGIFFAQALALPASAQAQNVGVVDKVKLYSAYPRLKSAADEIKKDEERIHKLIETSNKEFDVAKKAKKPEQELNNLHKRLQGQIDSEFKTFQTKALNMEKQLETELDNAIKAEAKAKSVTTVLDKSAVLLGGTDITDGVAQRLASSPAVTGNSAETQTK